MLFELINFDGYGFFIWSSYIITFFVLFFLFIKTKNSLKSYEAMYENKFKFSIQREANFDQQKRRKLLVPNTTSI